MLDLNLSLALRLHPKLKIAPGIILKETPPVFIFCRYMGQSQNPPNRKCRGVHFFYNRIYHTKVTSEPHCISWTDIDMGKTISTFLYYFLISFITSFSPKHFICALKKFVHNSVVPTDGAHTKVEFLNACIKRFGEKDVMNEIKK